MNKRSLIILKRAVILSSGFQVLFIPALAWAHSYPGESGFLSGLNHPVFGFDHLIAMVTVGLLSAEIGGRAIWTVPATFVSVMVMGACLGIAGIGLPFVEYGIAVSVLALGTAVVGAGRMPVRMAMGIVGFFALFHGHAHGTEMPHLAEPVLYAAGFTMATILLHIIGALTGYFTVRYRFGIGLLRLSGMLIAVSGIYFVMQV